MSRPFQHPKTGVFWLRKRVPTDLVATLGKVEERYSLKTCDPAEAKKRHAEEVLKLEAQWANLRAGPRSLTERECHDLAAAEHDRWLELHRADVLEDRPGRDAVVTPARPEPERFGSRGPVGPHRRGYLQA